MHLIRIEQSEHTEKTETKKHNTSLLIWLVLVLISESDLQFVTQKHTNELWQKELMRKNGCNFCVIKIIIIHVPGLELYLISCVWLAFESHRGNKRCQILLFFNTNRKLYLCKKKRTNYDETNTGLDQIKPILNNGTCLLKVT